MFKIYSTRLAIRIGVFVGAVLIYLKDKNSLIISNTNLLLSDGIKPLHIFWMALAAEMIQKFFPQKITSMGCRKQFKSSYTPNEKEPAESEIAAWLTEENKAAQKVFIAWFGGNAMVAVFYYLKILGESEMVLLSLFYFVCDLICVLLYCPFQSLIMKNRCCVTCRIFNWDSMMICTPLIFIRSFFSWSLVSIALILLIWWEFTYWKHPFRFFERSNKNLQCKYCNEKICKIKKPANMQHVRLGKWS